MTPTVAVPCAVVDRTDDRQHGRVSLRKDWLNILIATILGFVFTAAPPPESGRTIFTTFLRSIGILYPELPLIE